MSVAQSVSGQRLLGKVALISGGASGIGEAVALKFSQEGAHVFIAGLPGDPVPEVVERIRQAGGEADSYIGDVAVETQAEACLNEAIRRFDKLDVLVNLWGTPLEAVSTEHLRVSEFDHILYSNIRSVYLLTKFSLPHLKKSKGVVLASGSEHGSMGLSLNPSHGASLAWVHAFIKGVAAETADFGVRANSVCSGPVDHALTRSMMELDPELESRLVEQTPLARRGLAEEVAAVYAFLASDDASFVTGALYTVDGGLSSGSPVVRPLSKIKMNSGQDQEPYHRSEDSSQLL